MKEIWKDVPNYEGMYKVSNHGVGQSAISAIIHYKIWK